MEDKKIDELKSAMGSADLTKEQLQEQLKQKIQRASQTRAKFKNSTNSDTKRLPPKKQPMATKKSNFNKILAFLLVVTAILIFVAIYIFNKDKIGKEKTPAAVQAKSSTSFESMYNSKKYDTYNCYSFEPGKITFPIEQCKKEFDEFLKKNKDANRFEIVPIISKNDAVIYNQISKDIKNQPIKLNKKVKEYLNIGLATERILESVWYIKKILGESTIITSSQYYVESDNDSNQGVIIRAYH